MRKDVYLLNRIFGQYYPFILSGGTALYLYLALHQKKNNKQVEYSMMELELALNMSHTSIRKYEIILVMMGLLDIEIEHYHMYTSEGYQIKKKRYTLYKPLAPEMFEKALVAHNIPDLERAKPLFPAENTEKYEHFKSIYRELLKIADLMSHKTWETATYKMPIKLEVFAPDEQEEDVFSIIRLFDVYGFLPQKVIIFYLYIWRYWIQSDSIAYGIHIPRKQIKKELGYGDEQIREAMYQLCLVGLLDLQKDKYYRYFLIPPLAALNHIRIRSFVNLQFLLPKHPSSQQKYVQLYEEIEYFMKHQKKAMQDA